MRYLSVKNFDRYQQFKRKRPPWIKLYVSLLRDYEFGALSLKARYLYCGCLLLASEMDNLLPYDPVWLQKCLLTTEKLAHPLKELISQSFLCVTQSEKTKTTLESFYVSDSVSVSVSEQEGSGEKKSPRQCLMEFPTAWQLSEREMGQATSLGLNAPQEFARFRDYHQARGTRFKDWGAAWRNWTRKAEELQHGLSKMH